MKSTDVGSNSLARAKGRVVTEITDRCDEELLRFLREFITRSHSVRA